MTPLSLLLPFTDSLRMSCVSIVMDRLDMLSFAPVSLLSERQHTGTIQRELIHLRRCIRTQLRTVIVVNADDFVRIADIVDRVVEIYCGRIVDSAHIDTMSVFFFLNNPAPPEISILPLRGALPI